MLSLGRSLNIVNVHVNGADLEVPEGATVEWVLGHLELPSRGLAVELNLEIVPKRAWAERGLRAGDRLEVVSLVGGG